MRRGWGSGEKGIQQTLDPVARERPSSRGLRCLGDCRGPAAVGGAGRTRKTEGLGSPGYEGRRHLASKRSPVGQPGVRLGDAGTRVGPMRGL